MRKDVKVGIVIAIVVVAAVGLYFVLKDPGQPAPVAETPVADTQLPATTPPPARPTVRPNVPVATPTPAPTPPIASESRYQPIGRQPAVTTRPADETAAGALPNIARRLPDDASSSADSASSPLSLTLTPPANTQTPALPTPPKTYTVVAGDSGFWGVAQKVYGNGKHFNLIAAANPSVNSSRLQIGQQLVIPPLPATAASSATPTVSLASSQTPAAAGPASAGTREYIVKAGDSGFWGIARTVYGDGKYYPLIAKANPGVDSARLRIGQKLIIPPNTAVSAAVSPSPAAAPAATTRTPATTDTSAAASGPTLPRRPIFD